MEPGSKASDYLVDLIGFLRSTFAVFTHLPVSSLHQFAFFFCPGSARASDGAVGTNGCSSFMECDGSGALYCQALRNNKLIYKASCLMCYQKLGFSQSLPKHLQAFLYVIEGNNAVHRVEVGSSFTSHLYFR